MRCLLRIAVVLTIAAMMPVSVMGQATPAASPDANGSLASAVAWLQSQQAADGGWVGFSGTSDPGVTIDAVIALAAAAKTGIAVDLTAATAYLEANGAAYAESGAGQAAKLAQAAVALGADPTTFAGLDAVALMLEGYDPGTDMYGIGMYDTALVSLALGAVNNDPPDIVLASIKDRQMEDGSWAFDGTTTAGNGDTNTTAIIIQALVATEHTEVDLILHGLEYLQRSQLPQGFPFQPGPGAAPDANSTALAVQALMAAGEDPSSQEWQNASGSLAAFQNANGSFSYVLETRDDNLFATIQVIPALANQAFPVRAPDATPVAPEALPTCTAEQRQATPVADAELPCAA